MTNPDACAKLDEFRGFIGAQENSIKITVRDAQFYMGNV